MIFSYRTRQFLKHFFSVVLYILLAIIVLAFCLLLWLQRFIVYTADGVQLDFSITQDALSGVLPQSPQKDKVNIEYVGTTDPTTPPEEELPELPPEEESTRLVGYYIESSALQKDIATVRAQLEALPAGTPVMLDVKNMWGNFFYSSAYGNPSDSYDIAQVDALISYLMESDLYVIAKLPAFRNYNYALSHTSYGLATPKGYLWVDSSYIYWLDPTKDGTLTYLIQVIKELRTLGFDEVVLQDFYVPESENIAFSGDRQQVINETAQSLVTACATEHFTVSFVAQSPSMQLATPYSKLYLMDISAADVAEIVSQMTVPNKETDIVILAQSYDTRYNICSTLHPLSQAH